MLARELIDRFADAGVRLSAENGRLAFEGPREVLTPERIEELRRHKAELLAALAAPDPVAFEERSAIAEHDGGMPRQDAETLAAREQGFDDTDSLHGEMVGRWATEIGRLAKLPAVSPEGAEALKRAQAFISEGWALPAARLGWDRRAIWRLPARTLAASRQTWRSLRSRRPGHHPGDGGLCRWPAPIPGTNEHR